MDLKKIFKVFENRELKRWEFEPNEDANHNSYTVSFFECDNEVDAWIAVYLAITKKDKRQQDV